jgi:signal transduction histidine kinase/CheY-like chemotaxis protein/class 3 adenylate cyclase
MSKRLFAHCGALLRSRSWRALTVGWLMTMSWAGIMVGLYAASVTALQLSGVHDPQAAQLLFESVPQFWYQISAVAFLAVASVNVVAMAYENSAAKRQLAMMVIVIKLVACYTDWRLATSPFAIVFDTSGRPFTLERYMSYTFTSPTMVLILAQVSDFSPRQTAVAVASEVGVIVFGCAASVLPGALGWGALLASCLLYYRVMDDIRRMLSDASSIPGSGGAGAGAVNAIYIITVASWTLFPIAWTCSALRLLNVRDAEILVLGANFVAKALFSTSISYHACVTMDERRAVAQAVTEERERMAVMRDTLDVALKKKDLLLSVISHELRTPLNGIIGLSAALTRGAGGDLTEKGKSLLATIETSANDLLILVNQLLDTASFRLGKIHLSADRIDVGKLLDEVCSAVATLKRSGVTLDMIVDPDTPVIIADHGRVKQILYNLIGNALKFTEHGGVRIIAAPIANGIKITVTDTGPGIQRDHIAHIWEPFEQSDMSSTRNHNGAGLGLSISKILVQAQNGHIAVDSRFGVGSTFTVLLPLQPQDNVAMDVVRLHEIDTNRTSYSGGTALVDSDWHLTARWLESLWSIVFSPEVNSCTSPLQSSVPPLPAERRPTNRELHGTTMILSVDDDPVAHIVIAEILKPAGYLLRVETDPLAALNWLRTTPTLPDCIIVDCMMPRMSGHELCAAFRKVIPVEIVPVIMLSAKTGESNVVESLHNGCNDFLTKPISAVVLLSCIDTQMKLAPLRRRNSDAENAESKLLRLVFPERIIGRILRGETFIFDAHRSVAALVCTIVDFAELASSMQTAQMFMLLKNMFSAFDKLLERIDYSTVKSSTSTYLIVAGADEAMQHKFGRSPAQRLLVVARAMLQVAEGIKLAGGKHVRIRLGLSHGPAYSGVLSVQRCPQYKFVGHTINTAAQMANSCYPMCIHVNQAARDQLVQEIPETALVPMGGIDGDQTWISKDGEWKVAFKSTSHAEKPCPKQSLFRRVLRARRPTKPRSAPIPT